MCIGLSLVITAHGCVNREKRPLGWPLALCSRFVRSLLCAFLLDCVYSVMDAFGARTLMTGLIQSSGEFPSTARRCRSLRLVMLRYYARESPRLARLRPRIKIGCAVRSADVAGFTRLLACGSRFAAPTNTTTIEIFSPCSFAAPFALRRSAIALLALHVRSLWAAVGL